MKRFLSVVALVCVLSSSALAGDIPTGGEPAPGSNGAPTSTEPGQIPSGGTPTPSTEPGDIPTDGLAALLAVFCFLV